MQKEVWIKRNWWANPRSWNPMNYLWGIHQRYVCTYNTYIYTHTAIQKKDRIIHLILKYPDPKIEFLQENFQFNVERTNSETQVKISCVPKPGLLLSTVSTLEALGLDIQQCVISCFNDFSVQASCSEVCIFGSKFLSFFFITIQIKISSQVFILKILQIN